MSEKDFSINQQVELIDAKLNQKLQFISPEERDPSWVLIKTLNNKTYLPVILINIFGVAGLFLVKKLSLIILLLLVIIDAMYFLIQNYKFAQIFDQGFVVFNDQKMNEGVYISYDDVIEYGYDDETAISMVIKYKNKDENYSIRVTSGNNQSLYKVLFKKYPDKDKAKIKSQKVSKIMEDTIGDGPLYTLINNFKSTFKKKKEK